MDRFAVLDCHFAIFAYDRATVFGYNLCGPLCRSSTRLLISAGNEHSFTTFQSYQTKSGHYRNLTQVSVTPNLNSRRTQCFDVGRSVHESLVLQILQGQGECNLRLCFYHPTLLHARQSFPLLLDK